MVRVPVLSVRMTVVPPRVSAAMSLRTTPLRLAILSTPTARITVMDIGRPSGMAETAIATEVKNISSRGSPESTPTIKTASVRKPSNILRYTLNRIIAFCRGVFSFLVSARREAIFPNSVLASVRQTIAAQIPCVTRVPAKIIESWSAIFVDPSTIFSDFVTGNDSPVKTDSST